MGRTRHITMVSVKRRYNGQRSNTVEATSTSRWRVIEVGAGRGVGCGWLRSCPSRVVCCMVTKQLGCERTNRKLKACQKFIRSSSRRKECSCLSGMSARVSECGEGGLASERVARVHSIAQCKVTHECRNAHSARGLAHMNPVQALEGVALTALRFQRRRLLRNTRLLVPTPSPPIASCRLGP
jgi:hypothetical protein